MSGSPRKRRRRRIPRIPSDSDTLFTSHSVTVTLRITSHPVTMTLRITSHPVTVTLIEIPVTVLFIWIVNKINLVNTILYCTIVIIAFIKD